MRIRGGSFRGGRREAQHDAEHAEEPAQRHGDQMRAGSGQASSASRHRAQHGEPLQARQYERQVNTSRSVSAE